MAHLRLFLLGAPRVEVDDNVIDLHRRKVLAPLIYLAVTRQRHRRDTLATLFWPESDQTTARASLRREFYTSYDPAQQALAAAHARHTSDPLTDPAVDAYRLSGAFGQLLSAAALTVRTPETAHSTARISPGECRRARASGL